MRANKNGRSAEDLKSTVIRAHEIANEIRSGQRRGSGDAPIAQGMTAAVAERDAREKANKK